MSKLVALLPVIFAIGAVAVPLFHHEQVERRTDASFGSIPSFDFPLTSLDGWGGFSSMDDFDAFYGVGNFNGRSYYDLFSSISSSIVTSESVVCRSVDITIVHQQLAILREYVKKLLSVQICQVEVQTFALSQFQASLFDFSRDIRHLSGRSVGFDNSIAQRIVDIHDEESSINVSDFGFHGYDVGMYQVYPTGFNWNSETSPTSVASAYEACQSAADVTTDTAPSPVTDDPPAPTSDSCSSACSPDASGDVTTDTADMADTPTDVIASTEATATPTVTQTQQANDTATTDSSSANPNPASD